MNTFQLDCFLAVADHLNFAKAAEQMNISQPAVTHQIQSLEKELGVKLFRRTTRSVGLTIEGLIFLEDAKNIVMCSKRAVMRFQNRDDKKILDFSIGCAVQSHMEFLPDILKELSLLHPGLHPRIATLSPLPLFMQVEEGGMDAALSIRSPSLARDSLQYKEICKVPLICMFREDDPLAERETLRMEDEDVKQSPLIFFHPGSMIPETVQPQINMLEGKKPSELFFCETVEAAMLLVRSGFGIAIMPDVFLSQNYGLKKHVLAGSPLLSFGVYYKSLHGKPLLRDFVRLLKEKSLESAISKSG